MGQISIKPLARSEVELEGEIAAAQFESHRQAAIHNLNQNFRLDGFRPGHVPEQVLIDRLGEEKVLTEMAELVLREHYPKLVEENKIEALGRPTVTITKLARGNPLGFRIRTAVSPKFDLPDYRKIAAGIEAVKPEENTVTDQEVEGVVSEIISSRTPRDATGQPSSPAPQLTDEWVKTLGNFQGATDFKTKLRNNLVLEKTAKARDKRRLKIMAAIIEAAPMELPEVLIASELETRLTDLRQQLEKLGLKFDDYLKHLKKTEAELKTAWRDEATTHVKTALILNRLATAEKIIAPEAAVAEETKHWGERRPEVKPEHLETYVRDRLTGEAVWQFLEAQK